TKGLASRLRLGSAEEGSGVVGQAAGSLGHAQWSMRHSHTRAMSTNWEKKRAEPMAKPLPASGERGVFYPIFIAAELAAGYRYTTRRDAERRKDMKLKDRVAIVTGAARGIGQEYCVALARAGANVVATDLLSCEATVAKVRAAGGEPLEVRADVANEQSAQTMAAEAL